jgi:hypothetical protein
VFAVVLEGNVVSFAEYLKTEFGVGEPIFAEDISYKGRSRSWVYRELKKLLDAGELERGCRGVYFFPKTLQPWGMKCVFPVDKVVRRRYLTDGADVYGFYTGYQMLNLTGLTRQMTWLTEIVSNNGVLRPKTVHIGNMYVQPRKSRVPITKENYRVLQFLDLMSCACLADFDEEQNEECNRDVFAKYIQAAGITKQGVDMYLDSFPKRARTVLYGSGVYDELA